MILAIDTETTGTDKWHGCRPFLITGCDGRHNYHWFGKVNPLNRMEVTWDRDTLDEVQELLEDASELIFHNAKFDLHMLESIGIDLDPLWSKVQDTLIASHCLSSGETHKLKPLAIKYMDYFDDDEKELGLAVQAARKANPHYDIARAGHPSFPGIGDGKGTSWYKMDYWLCPEECLLYGMGDVERTWGLWQVFYDGLCYYNLLEQYETRKKLIRLAHRMETVGYNMYADEVREEIAYLTDLRESLTKRILRECKIGDKLDLDKERDLRFFLFTVLEIRPSRLTEAKGIPSVDKQSINEMIEQNPNVTALQLFQDYRIAGTQIGYLSSYLKWVCPDNRIRASIFITGTRETRQAYRDPNLQNLDKRTRHLFGPAEGYVWIDYDLVSIEPRIWAYLCGNKELIKVLEGGGSPHLLFSNIVFPDEYKQSLESSQLFKEIYEFTLYKQVKAGGLSLMYGAAKERADATFGKTGAYELISERMPEIPAFTASVVQEMWDNFEQHHWPHVTCLGGYKLDIPTDEPFVACNYKIQGTAGYIITEAMINVSENKDYKKYNCEMIQQVHDSIVVEVLESNYSIQLAESIKKSIEAAGLKYIPTCAASYKVKHNEKDVPF